MGGKSKMNNRAQKKAMAMAALNNKKKKQAEQAIEKEKEELKLADKSLNATLPSLRPSDLHE